MKKILNHKIFNLLIEAFFISDLWIFLYNFILNFLNHKFPLKVVTHFVIPGESPEPFEIPLYLTLSCLTAIAIYLFHKKIKYFFSYLARFDRSPIFNLFKLIFSVFLFILFVNNLGVYPMGKDIFPLGQAENSSTNLIYLSGYLSLIGLITFESGWLRYLVHKKNFFIYFYGVLLLIIGFITLRPGFTISWHDYPYIYGPVSEISHGKTIYTQVQSQYGFLLILLLVVLSKIHLISLYSLPILIWLLYIAEYFFCFYLIFKISRSFILAFIGLFSIITVNYYSLCCTIAFPQIGPLRWLPLIFLIFVFYKLKRLDSYWLIFTVSLLSFWVVDVGIVMLLAYGLSLFFLALVKIIDLKRLIKDYLLLGLTIVGIFFLINMIGLIFGYQLINIVSVFTKLQEYSRGGFGMLPMTTKTYFWLILFIYFSSLIYFFQKKQSDWTDQMLLFTANLTLFASIYYVGRSHPLNLFVIALFFLLTFFIFAGKLYNSKIINRSTASRSIFLTMLFLLMVVYPAFSRKEMLTINLKDELTKLISTKKIFDTGIESYLNSYFTEEKNLINKYLTEKNILVISTDDTYLLYLTDKASLLNINPLTATISQKDIDSSLQKVYQLCPKKIAIDCSAIGRCPFFWKLNYLVYPYQIILDRVSQRCHLKYKPQSCTSQLCIVTVQ